MNERGPTSMNERLESVAEYAGKLLTGARDFARDMIRTAAAAIGAFILVFAIIIFMHDEKHIKEVGPWVSQQLGPYPWKPENA